MATIRAEGILSGRGGITALLPSECSVGKRGRAPALADARPGASAYFVAAKFAATKSQFTRLARNVSTYFGRRFR